MKTAVSFACALFTLAAFAAPAQAQTAFPEQDADFSAFCREAFPGSAYLKRNQSWGAGHYCGQAGVLQGIDLDRACELTTGSSGYRLLGDRIICAAGPGPVAANDTLVETETFVDYCRSRFANGSYQFVAETPDNPHHCRQPGATGGFTLAPIDLSAVCGSESGAPFYKVRNGQVSCTTPRPTVVGDRRANAASESGGPRPPRDQASPRPTDTGSEETASNKTSTDGKSTSAASNAPRFWIVEVGSLKGATLRVDEQNGKVTGRLERVPADLLDYFQKWTTLELGDVVFTGQRSGESVTGRTILGITTPRQQPPGPAGCAGLRTSLLASPASWPELTATLTNGRMEARYRGINVWYQNGACGQHAFIDYPPLVKDGWVRFELVQAR
ncbi:hypothetical protein [Roseibium sediminicola]|uniref:YARHG domain-containing protein n=1 Tax=Roseibium sediminicola TaxID=2933272 RepID=A0ABT0GM87_9HYPH|nr:hypothetical protein [Roseibium sp. CAU 1639]MCK7610533.1 hypothetical protein [Roseibium sp. CAU 1639]